jgi:hypothetical protein
MTPLSKADAEAVAAADRDDVAAEEFSYVIEDEDDDVKVVVLPCDNKLSP